MSQTAHKNKNNNNNNNVYPNFSSEQASTACMQARILQTYERAPWEGFTVCH